MKLRDFFPLNEGTVKEQPRRLSNNSKKGFLEIVARYQSYGEKLRRPHQLSEIAKTLGVVAGAAERFTLSEADDWFDEITIKRNMKELKKYNEEFDKVAKEAQKLEYRMESLYEDMGNVLNRYFEISDIEKKP